MTCSPNSNAAPEAAGSCPPRCSRPCKPSPSPVPRPASATAHSAPPRKKPWPQLDNYPAPFPEFAAFLRQLAAGQLPPIPHGLPAELGQWLEDFAQAIRDAPRG